jgi:hypothetical protein
VSGVEKKVSKAVAIASESEGAAGGDAKRLAAIVSKVAATQSKDAGRSPVNSSTSG